LALAVVRDLREHRVPASEEELADFETDVLAGFVLARSSAGLVDSTICNDINHLERIGDWFGRPLWEIEPADADVYFGKVHHDDPRQLPHQNRTRRNALRCRHTGFHGPGTRHRAVAGAGEENPKVTTTEKS
jgi:hypothetical protein